MKKILTIVGARPQFVKAAVVSRVIKEKFSDKVTEVILHTGQHFDEKMSEIFFLELGIDLPKYNLEVSGLSHGAMTGRMLEGIEKIIKTEKPDYVLVYGDTNSTLAGALAAVKLHVKVVHVEAGLRSGNMNMPEEVNRILTDRISHLLFCPTESSVHQLNKEGIFDRVINVGDVMYDAAVYFLDRAKKESKILESLHLRKPFALATCHRPVNIDDKETLTEILRALDYLSSRIEIVVPLHPRTQKLIETYDIAHFIEHLVITDPLSYLDILRLESEAEVIITDSGGMQKEAYFLGVPCVTMREDTEWSETVTSGWNVLAGSSFDRITQEVNKILNGEVISNYETNVFGNANSGEKIIQEILNAN